MEQKQARNPVVQTTDEADPSILMSRVLRTVDDRGIPSSLAVVRWWEALGCLAEARRVSGVDWPSSLEHRLREMARTALRFTRPDGSVAFGPAGAAGGRANLIQTLAAVLDDEGLATVAKWWFGRRSRTNLLGSPPLPAVGDMSRPIAMLRADWSKRGDFLAIDGRDPANPQVELNIGGQPLVGPAWPGTRGRARMRLWITSSTADCAEWSVGTGADRIVRTAILLRGRGLAILAEQRATTNDGISRTIALSEGVAARPIANSRALMLRSSGIGSPTSAIPLALDPAGGGSFVADRGMLSLTAPTAAGPRVWLPLLFSWDENRVRKAPRWRQLTVSEKGRICPPSRAFAARVSWGSGDGLIVYRSLTKPATRTFLGHQTSATLLVGLFSPEGNVTPLLKVE